MTEQVWLTITGEQISSDGEKERNQTKCRAKYKKAGESHVLFFEELCDGASTPIANRLLIDHERIVIHKTGMVVSNLVLQNGHTHDCLYETPYGALPMKIQTSHVACLETAQGIHARARYRLALDPAYTTECTVTIRIEPLPAEGAETTR
ncbi:MAG: DUF1934 domain-containing protein [Eubacteriales bacterium]|nr:DUF1934 domain-containing protein [Eubacteriales bacterium]